MKQCYKCKTEKELSEFHKNSSRKDGHQNYCKICAKVRNHEYYARTPERNPQRRASAEKSRERNRAYSLAWLSSHPCVDCGESDPVVLEYDHVSGDKLDNISVMVAKGVGLDLLITEIGKCEVRCANCHRRVTALRGGWRSKELIIPLD